MKTKGFSTLILAAFVLILGSLIGINGAFAQPTFTGNVPNDFPESVPQGQTGEIPGTGGYRIVYDNPYGIDASVVQH